jgi:hypothetical protein
MSGMVANEIKQAAKDAEATGQRGAFLSSLVTIYHRLQRDPLGFGEACFELQVLHLTFVLGAIRPAAVRYAVNQHARTVYVKAVILMGS